MRCEHIVLLCQAADSYSEPFVLPASILKKAVFTGIIIYFA